MQDSRIFLGESEPGTVHLFGEKIKVACPLDHEQIVRLQLLAIVSEVVPRRGAVLLFVGIGEDD
jgi:hypothetical protein